jgi:hypothetical protein
MRSFLDGAVLGRSLADLPGSGGLATQFLITAFDYDRRRAVYFRSNTVSLAGTPPSAPSTVTLEQAVHASSEAPINYFDGPAEFEVGGAFGAQRRRYWDGGLSGLNNPVFAAVIEALANGQPRERIQVLSIGTGTVMLPMEDDTIAHPWARRQSALGIFHPPDAATFHAYVALGQPLPPSGRISVVRMNPIIQPKWDPGAGKWQPRTDLSLEEFSGLVEMDLDPMRQKEIDLIVKFCDLWLGNSIWNQPIRPGQDMSCDIGQRTFEDARAAWNGLSPV